MVSITLSASRKRISVSVPCFFTIKSPASIPLVFLSGMVQAEAWHKLDYQALCLPSSLTFSAQCFGTGGLVLVHTASQVLTDFS